MGSGVRTNSEMRARRRQEIVRLAQAGHDVSTLLDETVRVLREAIPCEAGCWHVLDPATLVETSYRAVNLPIENPLAAEIEYLHEDYNQFATLARASQHSGILSVATAGTPERSLRYRELIRPSGLHGELRATFVCDGAAWGSICMLRERSSRDFTEQDARFAEEISGHVGHGIRTSLILREASANPDAENGPGLVLLDDHLRLDAMTPAAERLLEELVGAQSEEGDRRELPYVIYAIAAKARLAGHVSGAKAPAHAHVRARSGRWLTLHGSLIAGGARSQIAVIIESAEPLSLAPMIMNAYGLTSREGHVVLRMLQGLSTKQIATALRISPYTVQEHCTAIFDKIGVRSRRELVGMVFLRFYASTSREENGVHRRRRIDKN